MGAARVRPATLLPAHSRTAKTFGGVSCEKIDRLGSVRRGAGDAGGAAFELT